MAFDSAASVFAHFVSILVVLALGLVVGCQSPAWEPGGVFEAEVAAEYGVVAGSDTGLCAEVGLVLDEVARRVEGLALFEAKLVRVELMEEWPYTSIGGFARGTTIVLPAKVPSLSTMGHEIAHAWMDGTEWSLLGQVLSEGVCFAVGAAVDCQGDALSRVSRGLAFAWAAMGWNCSVQFVDRDPLDHPALPGTFESASESARLSFPRVEVALLMRNRDYREASHDVGTGLTGLGWLMVSRIGLPRLGELCREARSEGHDRVSTERLLAEAQLPRHYGRGWEPLIDAFVGADGYLELLKEYCSVCRDLTPDDVVVTTQWN